MLRAIRRAFDAATLTLEGSNRLKTRHVDNYESKKNNTSGRRCILHNREKAARNSLNSWAEAWAAMEPVCQEAVLKIPVAMLR